VRKGTPEGRRVYKKQSWSNVQNAEGAKEEGGGSWIRTGDPHKEREGWGRGKRRGFGAYNVEPSHNLQEEAKRTKGAGGRLTSKNRLKPKCPKKKSPAVGTKEKHAEFGGPCTTYPGRKMEPKGGKKQRD